ncbi:MAG: CotH kinase family protein [Saprospiraceae bacterium]
MKKAIHNTVTLLMLLLLSAGLRAAAPADVQLDLDFSLAGGFYESAVEVELSSPGAEIYFSLDGSMPTRRSQQYLAPIVIRRTTVLRAVAYRDNIRSRFMGHTYFIGEAKSTFAVISLAVTPALLFDAQRGLFMQGSVADSLWNKPNANFWTRREVPMHVEFYETDGSCAYNSLSGMRLFGGMSRLFPQKSLAIIAREGYGEDRIRHPVFGKEGPKSFKSLVLRNSGSDWGKTHFRDALMTGLLDGWDIEKQAYRPAHVYINGKYWGIYNIREKINRHFIESHSDVDKDSIDFMEHRNNLRRGSRQHYSRLLKYLAAHDLSKAENFAWVERQMDVDNFMNYQIAQIYFDNQDAGGNIKYWRPKTQTGRWRWILYDTDWGFSLQETQGWRNNSLAFHTAPDGPDWPNPPWSTFVLRKLLENPGFRTTFVNRFADHLNASFHPERVIARIDSFYQLLQPEMPKHLKRWQLSPGKWESQVNLLRTFANERPAYMRQYLQDMFRLGDLRNLVVEATGGGAVLVNDCVRVHNSVFEGVYFERVPVNVRALADYGYRFVGWEGVRGGEALRSFDFLLKSDRPYRIRAIFEKYEHPLMGRIIVNEVSANNKKTGDWVELFNSSDKRVSLLGWIMTDGDHHEFAFPDVTIAPNDYLVVCQDIEKFRNGFPRAYNAVGGLGFGLHKRRETLCLFSAQGASVDSITYDLPPTDSVFTLNLLIPQVDNADPENWAIASGVGSPNAANPYYLESKIRLSQKRWIRIGFGAGLVLVCLLLLGLKRKGML